MIKPSEAAEYSRQKVFESVVSVEPYPNVRIENIWPDELYDAFLEKIPLFDLFEKVGDLTGNFFHPYLREACGEDVWIIQCYDSCMAAITSALVDRFGDHLPEYVCSLWPQCDDPASYFDPKAPVAYPQPGLVERVGEFVQPPHLDGIFRAISAFLYLPSRSLPGAGTSLYSTTATTAAYSPLRNMFTRQPDGATVQLHHTNDFSRNTLFAFVNSHRAYHGISLVDYTLPDDVRRVSINMFIEPDHNKTAYLIGRGMAEFGIANADI